MSDTPTSLRRELREAARLAHAAELKLALTPLAEVFDSWRAGTVQASELVERIHEFRDGVNREIYERYTYHSPKSSVGHAIAVGALDREALSPQLLAYLGPSIQAMKTTEEIVAILTSNPNDDTAE